MKTKCICCGRTFEAQRKTAKYCSTKCRVEAKRARDNAKDLKAVAGVAPKPRVSPAKLERDAFNALMEIKSCAVTLDVAAANLPTGKRETYALFAQHISTLFKEVGL